MRRGRGAWTRFREEPGEKGRGAGLRCHRAGVVVPGRRAGGRRCWSNTVIRSGSSASTSNGNSMAHCARRDPPRATSLPPLRHRPAHRHLYFPCRAPGALGGSHRPPPPPPPPTHRRPPPTTIPAAGPETPFFLPDQLSLSNATHPIRASHGSGCHSNAFFLGLVSHSPTL